MVSCDFFVIFQHYTELNDIKRVIINTHAIEPQVCIYEHSASSLMHCSHIEGSLECDFFVEIKWHVRFLIDWNPCLSDENTHKNS